MSKTHLVIPDQHAHPDYHNDRADWLGQLIKDIKPDVVVNIGDAADMASMSTYDRGTKGFIGRNYEKDIDAHLEFQDRLWSPVKKAKKKQPRRLVIEGNHEHRIKKAINLQPELEGERFGVSFKDLQFDDYYHEVIEYEGGVPGIVEVDGIHYSHFLVSGVMGRPIGGEHHAYSLLAKQYTSCTVGHSHLVDFAVRTRADGVRLMGCVVGVYQDYRSDWAGAVNDLWWSGVVVKRNVEDGMYDPQFISMEAIKNEYS